MFCWRPEFVASGDRLQNKCTNLNCPSPLFYMLQLFFSTFIVLFLFLQVSCLKVANVRITVNVDNIATPSNGNVVNDFDGFI